MADRVLNATQYAEYLGFCIQTFSTLRKKNPSQFAPSFTIGRHERWFESTVESFHKSRENNSVVDGIENDAPSKGECAG